MAEKRPATLLLLPMEIRAGDTFTDEQGEWIVVGRPFTMRGGKVVRAQARRADRVDFMREVTWPAYERIAIQRRGAPDEGGGQEPPPEPPPAKRRGRSR